MLNLDAHGVVDGHREGQGLLLGCLVRRQQAGCRRPGGQSWGHDGYRLADRGQHGEHEQLQAERGPVLEMGEPDVQDAGTRRPRGGARELGQLGQRGGGPSHVRGGHGPVAGVRPRVADELHFRKAPTSLAVPDPVTASPSAGPFSRLGRMVPAPVRAGEEIAPARPRDYGMRLTVAGRSAPVL